jgi:peptidoglycan hydrolase-like protein with peptidoglycan-binding domain
VSTHFLRRRRFAIPAAAVLVAALIAGGWALALAFESPAQREADAAPPTPGPITAKVERGDLRDTVSFRATARRQESASVALPAQGADPSVVTAAPVAVGTDITAGRVATEINGRPVFALPGSFAYYRDLRPGDSGPDVRQLQTGLAASGARLAADGVFGASTDRAVRALYKRAGYEPATTSGSPGTTGPDQQTGDASAPPTPGPTAAPAPAPPTLLVPRAELLVLATMPATLTGTPPVGTVVTAETDVTVDWGAPCLVATAPVRTAERLTAETTGTATTSTETTGTATTGRFTSTSGQSLDVRVDTVTPATGDDTADSTVTLTGADGPLDPSLLGQEGTAILDLQVVAEDSLLVPTIAVIPGGKGVAHLRVRRPDGTFRRIEVTEIAELRGRSAVRPTDPESLRAGDVVRVG